MKQSININPDELTEINEELIPMSLKKARIQSLIWPGIGHLYAEHRFQGLFLIGASAFGFFGTIGTSNYLNEHVIPAVNRSYDAYSAAGFGEVEEKKAAYLSHLDNKNKTKTEILYFSGLYITSQILSFWHLGKVIPPDNHSLEFNVDEDQALLEYRFDF